ncbi:unnamed protein product [Symbiodinium sp. CCMP2592]|nr:unnamed protein product [Symbiodinium sp. CCMP2592]
MGTVLSQTGVCCVQERSLFCSSFEFLWAFVGRDRTSYQSLAVSSSSGSPCYQSIGPPPAPQFVEQEELFGEHRVSRPSCLTAAGLLGAGLGASAQGQLVFRGCAFGNSCRRSNPQHFLDESHPTDPDHHLRTRTLSKKAAAWKPADLPDALRRPSFWHLPKGRPSATPCRPTWAALGTEERQL